MGRAFVVALAPAALGCLAVHRRPRRHERETIYVAGTGTARPRHLGRARPGSSRQKTLLHMPGTVRVSCSFDDSRADQPIVGGKQLTPRYVVWGEGTTVEMCLGRLSVATP